LEFLYCTVRMGSPQGQVIGFIRVGQCHPRRPRRFPIQTSAHVVRVELTSERGTTRTHQRILDREAPRLRKVWTVQSSRRREGDNEVLCVLCRVMAMTTLLYWLLPSALGERDHNGWGSGREGGLYCARLTKGFTHRRVAAYTIRRADRNFRSRSENSDDLPTISGLVHYWRHHSTARRTGDISL
jgi:hypothetical protein